jgi:hypothetical protein
VDRGDQKPETSINLNYKERLMEKLIHLFEDYIHRAMTMTENFIHLEFTSSTDFESFTSNRERLLLIIDQISRQVKWDDVDTDKRLDLNRQLEYLKKLDDQLIMKLKNYQQDIKLELEQTVKAKNNLKNFNLSEVK